MDSTKVSQKAMSGKACSSCELDQNSSAQFTVEGKAMERNGFAIMHWTHLQSL